MADKNKVGWASVPDAINILLDYARQKQQERIFKEQITGAQKQGKKITRTYDPRYGWQYKIEEPEELKAPKMPSYTEQQRLDMQDAVRKIIKGENPKNIIDELIFKYPTISADTLYNFKDIARIVKEKSIRESPNQFQNLLQLFATGMGQYQAQQQQRPSLFNIPQMIERYKTSFRRRPITEYQEGQTATNPRTDEKVIFKDGQWQPLQR